MKDTLREKIIKPLLRLKPLEVDMSDFLAIIFSTHSRIISSYYVKTDFRMPGLYLENGCIPVQGVGNKHRKIRRLDSILVRVDDKDPNVINTEYKGHVFQLTGLEWASLKKHLIKRKGCEEI